MTLVAIGLLVSLAASACGWWSDPEPTAAIDPRVPEDVQTELRSLLHAELPDLTVRRGTSAGTGTALVGVGGPGQVLVDRVFAVVAPFATVADAVDADAVTRLWQGDVSALANAFGRGEPALLSVAAADVDSLSAIVGTPPAESVRVVADGQLAAGAAAWAGPSVALMPFEQVDQRWKLLQVDGTSLLDASAPIESYPFSLQITVSGDDEVAEAIVAAWPATTNRDPARLAVVALTGTTAMARGTARAMEANGITSPGTAIADWLRSADVAHISNEASFWDGCGPPRSGQLFCSDPRYLALLTDVGTDVVELTGNHLNDFGPDALVGTIDAYTGAGLAHYGGGRDEIEASTPLRMEIKGNRIAFVGCNWFGPEGDFATASQAGSARCGTVPGALDLIESSIAALRAEGWLVIATIQYEEFTSWRPPQDQIDAMARLRSAGAVVVSGSQGHNLQGYDVDATGLVHWGLGNLFFLDQNDANAKLPTVDRHVFYDGRYVGVDIKTAGIVDQARVVPLGPTERADVLAQLFSVSNLQP